MKQITLDSKLYTKIYSLSDEVLKKIENWDMDYLIVGERIKKIYEFWYAIGIWEWLFETLVNHYLLFDYATWYINKVQDNSKELNILKTNIIWVFEIINMYENSIVYLDVFDSNKYEIFGEWMWSEKKLQDLNIWDIVIARLINMDWEWYNLRNYSYIFSNEESLKSVYKYLLNWAKDIYDIFERLYLIAKWNEEHQEDINYERRIKKIFWNKLTNKLDKELNKILKSISEKTFSDFNKFLSNFKWFSKNEKEQLELYITSLINLEINKDSSIWNDEFKMRIQLVTQALMDYLKKEFKNTDYSIKLSKKDEELIEKEKENWLKTPNSLFSLKTPEFFLQEADPNYEISNLRFTQISVEELEFYDWYKKYFTEWDHKIYKKALKNSLNWKHKEAVIWYEELLIEHSDFFRLKWNHIVSRVNDIKNKYINVDDSNLNIDYFELDELDADWNFMVDLKMELKNLEKLKQWYKIMWDDKVNELVEYLVPILSFMTRVKRKSIIEKLVKEDNEVELIRRIKEIIPDFDLDEFIKETLIIHTTTDSSIYDGRIIIYDYKADDMYPIFEYLWKKYKKPNDFIIDDIFNIYEKIWKNKINIKALDEFNKFIFLKTKEIKSKKSKIRLLFSEFMNFWNIIHSNIILDKIQDINLKNDFIKALEIILISDYSPIIKRKSKFK